MLSKSITKREAKIYWGDGDDPVAIVRPLSPDDFCQILVDLSEDVGGIFDAWDRIDKIDLKAGRANPEFLAEQIISVLPSALAQLRVHLPSVLARIVARAADEPDAWEYVRDNYDANLQFMILAEVARITFINVTGFKAFMGNVVALVGVAEQMTSAKKAPQLGSPDSSDGSPG